MYRKNDLYINNNYTIENHINLVRNELNERGYNKTIIEEWIAQIE